MRKVFINCGARTGNDILNFRHFIDTENEYVYYAFECFPPCLDKLNSINDVTVIDKAVSTKVDTLTFYTGKTDYSGSLVNKLNKRAMSGKTIEVESIDFDAWMKDNIQEDDYVVISMDIEGTEYDVLNKMISSGSINLIDELYLEFHKKKVPGLKFEDHDTLRQYLIDMFKDKIYIDKDYNAKAFSRINDDNDERKK